MYINTYIYTFCPFVPIRFLFICVYTVGPRYPWLPRPGIQPTMDQKYSGKNFRKFPKVKLIRHAPATVYIEFTLYLQLFFITFTLY